MGTQMFFVTGVSNKTIDNYHTLLEGTKANLSKEQLTELIEGSFKHYTGKDALYPKAWEAVCKASRGLDYGNGEELLRIGRAEKVIRFSTSFICGRPSNIISKFNNLAKQFGDDAHISIADNEVEVHTYGEEELDDYYKRVGHLITRVSYSLHSDEWDKLAKQKAELERELKIIEEKMEKTI